MQANTISKHLDHIYESGELTREAAISILETAQIEGNREVKRNIEYLYKFSMGSPKDFETLPLDKLSHVLDIAQKEQDKIKFTNTYKTMDYIQQWGIENV